MEYILFIHNDSDNLASESQWEAFFEAANQSGMFNGGSEIGKSIKLGEKPTPVATRTLVGYMRFQADDVNQLRKLLELHPVAIQGGTLELCETPRT